MKKIESLTPEQQAKLPLYRADWIKIGLTEESPNFDRTKKESAVKLCYKCVGLNEPKTFIWVESPLHAGICYAHLKSKKTASVWDSVRASVGDSVWASVGDSVCASVGDSVWASVADSVWDSCFGSLDVGWLAFYNFFHAECGLDLSKLNGLWASTECGWFIPFADTVIISPRPYKIRTRINARGNHQLHGDGEPAVFCCKDFQIFANSGVRLPEKYGSVKTKDWESSWLLSETNSELRMCLIKNIGYDKICQELEAKKLDSWREYELIRIDNADVEPIVLLKMICPSTGKIHASRMPPDCLKARDAATLLNCGIDPETFLIEH